MKRCHTNIPKFIKNDYCENKNGGPTSENCDFCKKSKKTEKMADVQTRITFFVSVWQEKHKYESDAEFYGDFKNDHHLSNSLN